MNKVKTIKNKQEFLELAKKAGLNISNWAKELLDKVEYGEVEDFKPITKTLSELGFTGWISFKDIQSKLKELELEPLTHVQALDFALNYKNKEWKTLMIKPITDSRGTPCVFSVERRSGGSWLEAYDADPDSRWDALCRFVFVSRKLSLKTKSLNSLKPSTLNSETFESLTLRIEAIEKRLDEAKINI